ncbi:MAG: DEAD/DEAH box helicase [Solirubrobacterales bacterium]
MKRDFNNLGVSPPILEALEEMGFETPTEVQHEAIPVVLNQEDMIVISKTGSGKTAAFGVPLLQLTDPAEPGPQGLILTPTRELAVQVDSDLKRMAKHLPHKTTSVYGQHSMNAEIQALQKGATIVTGTPGRVFDHISHGHLKTNHIRFLVLDEADRMLDMGFFDQVMRIVRTIPKNRVTLLFSATIPPEVRRLCLDYMKKPVTIEIESQTKTVDTTEQIYYRVDKNNKNNALDRLLLIERPESCMIFCNQRNTVDRLQIFLDRKGYASRALHGDIPQVKRLKTIQQFKQGDFHLLVATDVAARGLHIDDLSLVINYDLPLEKDGYIHRIGRTGRAGAGGRAVSLVTSDDIMSMYEIEEHIGAMIAEEAFPQEPTSEKQKALIDKWLQSNALKRKLLTAAPEPAQTGTGTQPPRKRNRSGQPGQQRERANEPATREQQVRRGGNQPNQPKPAKPAQPAQRTEQVKPAQTPQRLVQPRPQEPQPVHSKASPEIVKSAPAAKQSFFQRVFNRFTGGKKHG